MGFRYRGRTKGKGMWINYSASSRGPGASVSMKLGPLTLNSRGRSTLNLGNGITYVGNWKKKKETPKQPRTTYSEKLEKSEKLLNTVTTVADSATVVSMSGFKLMVKLLMYSTVLSIGIDVIGTLLGYDTSWLHKPH